MPRKLNMPLPETLREQFTALLTGWLAPLPDAERDLALRMLVQCAEGLLSARGELRRAKRQSARRPTDS